MSGRAWRCFERRRLACGVARVPTAATPRPTIRVSSSDWVMTPGRSDVRVRWPSGRIETLADVSVDRYVTLTEGTGK